MHRKMNYLLNNNPLIMFFSVLLVITVFALIFSSESYQIKIDKANHLNTNWTIDLNGSIKTFDLPYKFDIDSNQYIDISTELGVDFDQPKMLLIRSSLQDVIIKIDDVVIYEKTYQSNQGFPPYASMWHFVELPENSFGKILTISTNSPYEAMSGQFNTIYYGTEAQLFSHIFTSYGFRFIVSAIVLLGGLIMMVINMLMSKTMNKGNMYLGLFMILISLWMIAESRMIQFFVGSQWIIGSLAYLMLALFPIPLLIYIKNYIIKAYHKLYLYFIIIFSIQAFLILLFQGLSIMDFFESVIITQILIVLAIILAIITLWLDYKKRENVEAFKILKALGLLMIFGILELINFIINNFESTSVFLLIGIIATFLNIMYNYTKYLVSRIKMSYEKEIYEKLATIDQLTGAYNRMSFERDLENLFSDVTTRNKLMLIFFDLDDLKTVNDNEGHLMGDQLLIDAYHHISKIYEPYGTCYRIGGDEFACLITTDQKEEMGKYWSSVDESGIDQKNEQNMFNISVGYATYNPQKDQKPSDLVKRADDQMYLHKKQKKSKLKTQVL